MAEDTVQGYQSPSAADANLAASGPQPLHRLSRLPEEGRRQSPYHRVAGLAESKTQPQQACCKVKGM